MSEAFVYLWYDAPNDMYYLGKHKGSLDDTYTHSSTIWESFTKDCIPEGVTRRILAYGTDEEMCILENELLVNRKKRCWNRYYNNGVGDPRYVDQSGENNHQWKGGIKANDPVAYMKAYRAMPENKARMKKYNKEYKASPKRKSYEKAYRATPKYKAYVKEYRAKKKSETGFARGYSQAKKKAETQGEGTLKAFLG